MKKFDIFVVYVLFVLCMDKAKFIRMENVLFSWLDISITFFGPLNTQSYISDTP